MWPFRRKPLLDAAAERWHLDNFAWLVRNHGKRSRFAEARLVLPSQDFFAADGQEGHALAVKLFEQVKAYSGMGEADIALRLAGSPPSRLGTPEVTYAAETLGHPQSLIATLAHELAGHLLAAGTGEAPPIGPQGEEHLTDLTAVYLGFGVLLANSAFNMQAHADGWSYTRQGYLPEQDLVFALAIFLVVKQLDPAPALHYLKAELGAMLRKALRDLQSYKSEIAAMRLAGSGLPKQPGPHPSVVT